MPSEATVEITKDIATVQDTVCTGYVDRMTYRQTHELVSSWKLGGKNPEFREMKLDGEVFNFGPGAEPYHLPRVMRAKSRHLRLLKEHLGLLAKKTYPKKKVIIAALRWFQSTFSVVEVEVNRDGSYRRVEGCSTRFPNFADYTPELMARIEQYKAHKEQLEAELRELMKEFK